MAFGTAIAGMNLSCLAMAHLPFGVAMTIQLAGPLAVSLLMSRRWTDAASGLLAAAGIALFALPGTGGQPLSPAGLAWAVASALSMGAYLLLSRRAGARMAGGGPLALAVCWAAVLTLPFGLAQAGARVDEPHVLLAGLGVALLSAAAPYSLELAALRRLPARVVGVLQSLEPVAAGCAGLVLLGEHLSAAQWLAVGCITAASSGTVLGHWAGGQGIPLRQTGDQRRVDAATAGLPTAMACTRDGKEPHPPVDQLNSIESTLDLINSS
ncbi:EamA family transporter [Streptomyces sp. 3N207]|uniref:EamA family transporter n=1 Tax=Streptomyces sp. 3N207 TaxID=3457417 RepID=UPI003FCF7C9F